MSAEPTDDAKILDEAAAVTGTAEQTGNRPVATSLNKDDNIYLLGTTFCEC